jgi:hypothetical protein
MRVFVTGATGYIGSDIVVGEGLPMWSGAVEEPLRSREVFLAHINEEIAGAVLYLITGRGAIGWRTPPR